MLRFIVFNVHTVEYTYDKLIKFCGTLSYYGYFLSLIH